MLRSETIAELAKALTNAQAKVRPAIKDSDNPAFKGSRYADLNAILDACEEALTVNGLAIIQAPLVTAEGAGVETLLAHVSGEWVSQTLILPLQKQTAQGVGSCITYARRYALQGFLRIRCEDDDGNAASAEPVQPQQEQTPEDYERQVEQQGKELKEWMDWLDGQPDLEGVNKTMGASQVSQGLRQQVWLLLKGYAQERGWQYDRQLRQFVAQKGGK